MSISETCVEDEQATEGDNASSVPLQYMAIGFNPYRSRPILYLHFITDGHMSTFDIKYSLTAVTTRN